MTPRAEAIRPPRSALLSFLREELAPHPGRVAAVLRIATCCTLVVAIGMLYRIPLTAYMAYAVFVVGCREAASTLLTGVVAALAFTIAVALSLLFYTLDASEPALRLPLMAASTFIGVFLTRTMALGPVAFLASFVLVLSQTLIDEIPSLEALTRFVLWLWVVVMVPVTVTVLVNLLIGENPGRLTRRTAVRLLRTLAAALRRGDAMPLPRAEAEAVELIELREHAGMLDRSLRDKAAIDTMLIETLAELLALYRLLPPGAAIEARLPFAEDCEQCATALERGAAPASRPEGAGDNDIRGLSSEARPVAVAMAEATARLRDGIARRLIAGHPTATPSAKALLVPDAFSNPAHSRFALKTAIAVVAAYIIYSGLDWPGISTAITTCFFVALGSLGETIHKATLRITGALVGGLAGGLCIVYVMPEMTDIGQLCLLIAVAAALGGWVATGSDLLAYAGMQGAFAFFLTVLQDYGPSTDLTAPRDRVVGILLGNILMTVVFSVLWPSSAVDRARLSLSTALRTLGGLLTDEATGKPGSRLAVVRALGEARRFIAIAAFELRMLPARVWLERTGGFSLDALDRVAAATFVVVNQEVPSAIAQAIRRHDQVTAAWLLACANRVAPGGTGAAAVLEPPSPGEALPPFADHASAALRAAIEAREFLQSEIERAVAVPT
jgi:multidrug resistance protein MdtO